MEPTEADKKPLNISAHSDGSSEKPASTCYSCHKALMAYPYVHGPASVWACLSCHDTDAEPCYSVKKPEAGTCYICHVEQQNEWTSKKYIHGPVNTGQCSICHNPHASDFPKLWAFGVESIFELCQKCHEK